MAADAELTPKQASWVMRALNPSDPTADLKMTAFLSIVGSGIALMGAEWWHARAITPNLIAIFQAECVLVGAGGAGWAAVDKMRTKDVPPPVVTKDGDA